MVQNQDLHTVTTGREFAYRKTKSISWSAVVSGALMAFGLTFLFHLLTLGIGLSIFTPSTEDVKELAFAGFLWTLFGGAIILFISGWKTGKLIRICPVDSLEESTDTVATHNPSSPVYHTDVTTTRSHCYHGMTHGFLAWILYLIISLVFALILGHFTAAAFLKSSFLNVPMSVSGSLNDSMVETKTTSATSENQTGQSDAPTAEQTAAKTNQVITSGTPSEKAEVKEKANQAGAEIIGLFLILALGAAAASIGSYLGVLSHKKFLAHKLDGGV